MRHSGVLHFSFEYATEAASRLISSQAARRQKYFFRGYVKIPPPHPPPPPRAPQVYLLDDGSSVPLIFGAEELYFFEGEEERAVEQMRAQLRLFESGAEACALGLMRLPWASQTNPAAAPAADRGYDAAASGGEGGQDSSVSSWGSSGTTVFSDDYRYGYLRQSGPPVDSVAGGAAAEEASPRFEIGLNGHDDSDLPIGSSELSTTSSSEGARYDVVYLDQRSPPDSGAGGAGEGPPSSDSREYNGYAHDDSGVAIFLGPSSGEGARGDAVYLDQRPDSVAGGVDKGPPSFESGGYDDDVYDEFGWATFLGPTPESSRVDGDASAGDPGAAASATEPETEPAVHNSYIYYGPTSTASSPGEAEAFVYSSTAAAQKPTKAEPAVPNSHIYDDDFSLTASSRGEDELSSSSTASESESSASAAVALEPAAGDLADGGGEPPRIIIDSESGSGYLQQLLGETDYASPSFFGYSDEEAGSSRSSREASFAPPPAAVADTAAAVAGAGAAAADASEAASSSAGAFSGASSATEEEDYTDEAYGYFLANIYGIHQEEAANGGGGDSTVSSAADEEPGSVVGSSDPAIKAEGGDYPSDYSSHDYVQMISRLFKDVHAAAAAATAASAAMVGASASASAVATGAAAPVSDYGYFADERARGSPYLAFDKDGHWGGGFVSDKTRNERAHGSPYLAFDEDGNWRGGFVSEEARESASPPGAGEGAGDGVGGATLAIN